MTTSARPRTVKRKKKAPIDGLACVDLFCGAGGLTEGLKQAGVTVVAGVDFDAACEAAYSSNHSGTVFHRGDVAELPGRKVTDWFGEAQVRVLAGCAPCQPFSTYAQRYETVGTERWGLLGHFARLVVETEPQIVTMENVPTVLKHSIFDDFVETLRRSGYNVWFDVVDSALYGLPQRRRRTVLLASKFGPIQLMAPTRRRLRTVRDALAKLPRIRDGQAHKRDPLHVASQLSELNLSRINASKPGGTWRDWPEHLRADCHRRPSGKTYPGVYGRMSWDEPAPTLTTQFFGFGNGRFGHPSQPRAISLREGAILQGFPRRYRFVKRGEQVEIKAIGRLIGNAVPVDLGRAIGLSIAKHVEDYRRRAGADKDGDQQRTCVASP